MSQKLSATLVQTLAAFSSIKDSNEGSVGDFDRVLHGCLDLLAFDCDSLALRHLFADLQRDNMTPSRAATVLECGELLVGQLDRVSVADILLPIAER